MARARDPRIVQVMAGLAGEYDVVLVARADGTIAADVRPLVRLSVTVIAEQTQDGRCAASRQRRRRRPLRLRLLPAGRDRALRRPGGQRGADQPRVAPGAGRRDERRARPGLARRAAARGDRPRPRGRLQPQGLERLHRPHRPAGRGQGRDRARRRHHPRPARLAQRRRRRQRDAAQRADRGRHPARLHPGFDERAPDEGQAHRQRPARKLRRTCRCRA